VPALAGPHVRDCRTPTLVPVGRRRLRRAAGGVLTMLTGFGVASLVFMMSMYALERRGPRFVLAFAAGCALSSAYGFVGGAWPFGVVEAVWALVAVRRWRLAVGRRDTGANARSSR
jgi:hypothetical protein